VGLAVGLAVGHAQQLLPILRRPEPSAHTSAGQTASEQSSAGVEVQPGVTVGLGHGRGAGVGGGVGESPLAAMAKSNELTATAMRRSMLHACCRSVNGFPASAALRAPRTSRR